MAFGTNSKMFVAFIEACLENAQAFNLSSDALKVALYNNTGTPDATVSLANTAYNVGQWTTTNEVYDGAEWPQGGQALDSITSAIASNVYTLDAANEVSTGTSATLADVRGCHIWDDTVAGDYGICFLSFGGANAVTDGTFTVQFAASGIATITV